MKLHERMNIRDKWAKTKVIGQLIEEGYGTFARRLKEYDFIIADVYKGHPVEVAMMAPKDGVIVINPGFLDNEKTFAQLSVIVRHELLHFLLVHQMRLIDHLKVADPKLIQGKEPFIGDIANQAMDWDLSRYYDEKDKEAAKMVSLNGRVIHGLVLESDHPEWLDKTMEEMFDLLMKDLDRQIEELKKELENQPEQEITLHKETHSKEYVDTYNKIVSIYDKDQYSDAELDDLAMAIDAGTIDIEDVLAGNI